MADAGAETERSGPIVFCNSPNASIMASRALARATVADEDCAVDLKAMLESDSKPTAITVSRTMRSNVTIRAKPLG